MQGRLESKSAKYSADVGKRITHNNLKFHRRCFVLTAKDTVIAVVTTQFALVKGSPAVSGSGFHNTQFYSSAKLSRPRAMRYHPKGLSENFCRNAIKPRIAIMALIKATINPVANSGMSFVFRK